MAHVQQHEFITLPEAVRRTGIGRRQYLRAIARGDLQMYRVGSWPRLRWSGDGSVLSWLESTSRLNRDRASERHQARETGQ